MKVYDFKVENAYGFQTDLHEYEGKVLLIINSATKCGFTPQYDALQDLYEKYRDEGFVILDFPCNQFHEQAPEAAEEIVKFCDANFGISFPIFNKVEVKGETAHPLYKWLVSQKPYEGMSGPKAEGLLGHLKKHFPPEYMADDEIKWNFTKFVIGQNGEVLKRFEPSAEVEEVSAYLETILP